MLKINNPEEAMNIIVPGNVVCFDDAPYTGFLVGEKLFDEDISPTFVGLYSGIIIRPKYLDLFRIAIIYDDIHEYMKNM